MNESKLKSIPTIQLKLWVKYHTGEKLNMILNELCNRGVKPL